MAIQRIIKLPNINFMVLSQGNLHPKELMMVIRLSAAVHGPITEEIRGDFTPRVDGKLRRLLEMSAKETTR